MVKSQEALGVSFFCLRRRGGKEVGLRPQNYKKIIKTPFLLFGNNYSQQETTKKSLGALNQVDSYLLPLRGCKKLWWGSVMKTSFPAFTSPAFFRTTCGCSNIYRPDPIGFSSFLGRNTAEHPTDYTADRIGGNRGSLSMRGGAFAGDYPGRGKAGHRAHRIKSRVKGQKAFEWLLVIGYRLLRV